MKVKEGVLLFLCFAFAGLLTGVVAETIVYFSSEIRQLFFYIILILSVFIFTWFIFIPLLKWFNILSSYSKIQLAAIISKELPEVDDKLINVLELANSNDDNQNSLTVASIEQKSKFLLAYDFNEVISTKKLSLYFKAFMVVAGLILCFVLFFGSDLKGGFIRLVHYDTFYEKPAPFVFKLENESLAVKKGDNLTLKLVCEGRSIPELVYVNISGSEFLMKNEAGFFSFNLEHVNNSFPVYFTDHLYRSKNYQIEVLPSPVILDFQVTVEPPSYTGMKKEEFSNVGDIKVTAGSKIHWKFKTVDTDSIKIILDDKTFNLNDNELSRQVFHDCAYFISIENSFFKLDSLLHFNIEVVPDAFPAIQVVQLRDSMNYTRFYFKGSVSDDYGFNNLSFKITGNKQDTLFDVPILKNLNDQDFYYSFDFKSMSSSSKEVHYYFEVADNDYFNGFKKTSSDVYTFMFPDNQQLLDYENNQLAQLDDLMEKSLSLSDEIKQSIDDLKYKSLGNNASDWELQQLAGEIVNKKNQLENVLNEIEKKNKELNQMMNSFSEEKLDVLQKQKEIEELLDDVMSDELKELLDEFNKLAQDFKKDDFNKQNDQFDMALDDLSKQLERNLQVLKRMKVEQKMSRLIDALKEVAENENINSNFIDQTKNYDQIIQSENANREQVKNANSEFEQAQKLNNELKKPLNLPSFENEFNEIDKIYEEVGELLQKKSGRKAGKGMNENAQKINELAFSLQQIMDQNQAKQQFENLQNLKQLLDNLVYLSLSQEDLLVRLNTIQADGPTINEILRTQNLLLNQSEMVSDSLYALAGRTPAISSVINQDLLNMRFSMNKAIDDLSESQLNFAAKSQQESITAINNLAVFLSETLKNIEKQMANSMPGDQQCDKPGGNGKGNMDMLKQSQQSMKEQLQRMIEQMKSGNAGNMDKSLGQTLAQQEMMQQMIRELLNGSEVGSSSKEQLKFVDQLIEQNKIDLMNRNLTQTTINRQNLILDRLLKAEHAEIEREEDKERKSTTAEEQFLGNPAEFFQYKKEETILNNQLERNNYKLKSFYLQMYNNYIKQLKKQD